MNFSVIRNGIIFTLSFFLYSCGADEKETKNYSQSIGSCTIELVENITADSDGDGDSEACDESTSICLDGFVTGKLKEDPIANAELEFTNVCDSLKKELADDLVTFSKGALCAQNSERAKSCKTTKSYAAGYENYTLDFNLYASDT